MLLLFNLIQMKRMELTPGKAILKLVLKHAVGRQNHGAQSSITYCVHTSGRNRAKCM